MITRSSPAPTESWRHAISIGSKIDVREKKQETTSSSSSAEDFSWVTAEVVRVNKKDGTLKLEYTGAGGSSVLRVLEISSPDIRPTGDETGASIIF